MKIEEYYNQLLGIDTPWEISQVVLKIQGQRVDIEIEYTDDEGPCPICGSLSPKRDDRKRHNWRHLDTMQFATYLHCEVAHAGWVKHHFDKWYA